MKTTSVLTAALVLAASVGCHINMSFNGRNFDYQGKTATTMQDDTIPNSIKTLAIESEFCDITVTASDEPASWSFDGKVWAKQQSDADTLVSSLRVTTEQVDDALTLRFVLPEDEENKLRGVEATLDVNIPATTILSVRNAHGDAIINGTKVSTTVNNRHGDIQFTSLEGETSFDCEHGETKGTGLAGTAKIRARHGEVEIQEVAAMIDLNARHSDLKLKSLGSSLQLDAQHGKAEIGGTLMTLEGSIQHYDLRAGIHNDDFASITVAAQHGDISLKLPESATPSIIASAEFGDVTSEFEPAGDESTINVNAKHGNVKILKASVAE